MSGILVKIRVDRQGFSFIFFYIHFIPIAFSLAQASEAHRGAQQLRRWREEREAGRI